MQLGEDIHARLGRSNAGGRAKMAVVAGKDELEDCRRDCVSVPPNKHNSQRFLQKCQHGIFNIGGCFHRESGRVGADPEIAFAA